MPQDPYELQEWRPLLADIEQHSRLTPRPLPPKRDWRRCENRDCGAPAYLRCRGCNLVRYCSQSCEASHRSIHRAACFPYNFQQTCEALSPLIDTRAEGCHLGTRFPLCRVGWYTLLADDLFPSAALYISCDLAVLKTRVEPLRSSQRVNVLYDPVTSVLAIQGRQGIVVGCWRATHMDILDVLPVSSPDY
jgi:hypothetical protein